MDNKIGINLRSLLDGLLALHCNTDLNDYKKRNQLITLISERLKENDWITFDNGTTFEKTFEPKIIK